MIYSNKWTDWDTSNLKDGDSLLSVLDTTTETTSDFTEDLEELAWPNPDNGADIMIGFTDRRVTGHTKDAVFTDQFTDAAISFGEPIVLIGTNDLLTPNFRCR